jgi:ubiquinone/menaquinone biosynthesis C-methylase UbiE/intracellular sulfur oxidation DsrE/DsrF family protein
MICRRSLLAATALIFTQAVVGLGIVASGIVARAQEKSVKPGINDSFRNPDVGNFTERFEIESREVYALREEIVQYCEIQPGSTVADIGAGTGLFTRLFSRVVGPEGRVIAVDISPNFLEHIRTVSRRLGHTNIDTLLCKDDSTELPSASVDTAFICDTYHHFEFPQKTMSSLFDAMKPGGRLILIDFRRIEGVSSDWTMDHVRAGQEVFEAEIIESGFVKVKENPDLLKENYLVVFKKPETTLITPAIDGFGAILYRPGAIEQPRSGVKVVMDATANAAPDAINKGLDRVARLLNLYGAAEVPVAEIKVAIVFHGEATKTILSDGAYQQRFGEPANPNLPLIRKLQAAGVEVMVCGQALNYKGFPDNEVADGIPVAASALTVLINRQADGYAYIPMH